LSPQDNRRKGSLQAKAPAGATRRFAQHDINTIMNDRAEIGVALR
jgi:hypothetical protein